MKKTILTLAAIVAGLSGYSQIDVKGKAKDATINRADQKTDQGIDEGLNKTEEGVKNLFKKKEKKEKTSDDNDKKFDETNTNSSNNNSSSQTSKQEEFKSYSKFDFVPGDRVIFFDDFSQDNLGDFPAKWNTNGQGEIVTSNLYPGKWLKMRNSTTYLPEISSKQFPENYTVEYDMVAHGEDMSGSFTIELTSLANKTQVPTAADPTGNTGLFLTMEMQGDGAIRFLTKNTINTNGEPIDGGANTDLEDYTLRGKEGEKFRVSIAVNKQRFRLYLNEKKALDLPKVLPVGNYNAVIFRMWGAWDENGHPFDALISNIRYAEGTTDMRSKLITDGKLVTHGILFDVNSDKIKAESYGTLKEISQVLKDNAAVKVKIIGYTDSDGDDKLNLDLSKRRAASVKKSLSADFGIDASRMETDGKGESEPASPNTTSEGKANNRRVEFIKM